jgi:uncharacterized protein (DUF305 family)
MTSAPPMTDDDADIEPTPPARSLVRALIAVLVVAVLVVAGTAGWLIGHHSGGSQSVSATSVDAGFARDMSTHHTQAITMAGYERDNTSNATLKLLAFDIETSQSVQLGDMQGWLDAWGLTRSSTETQMAWMAGHDHLTTDGLMPGMATPAQMDKLETLHGTEVDILFLQLMIHHHQGGLPMAQYAFDHAKEPYVRNLAQKMVQLQTSEIVSMEQTLRQLGGSPLPDPTS